MKKIISLIEKYKEIIMYLIFGVLTTVVNIITYFIGAKALHINYQIANVIAWVVCVTFAYITNKLYVFDTKEVKKEKLVKEIISFYSFRIVSLVIELLLMYVMVSLLNINDMISKVVISVVVIILNYIFSKIFIFKKNSHYSKL